MDLPPDVAIGRTMNPSWRKPVGVLAILVLIAVWAILVASLSTFVGTWPILAQSGFYLIAGIAWIFPLRPLLRWMEIGKWRE
jgi:Protein of unknown function (DUF2842)